MEQMNAEQDESVNVDRFMELVDRYTDFTELTTPMLNEFIDKVIVYERRKINRYQYDQQIEIYFNFIGKVTLPEEEMEAAPEAPKTLHVASNSSFAPIGDYLSAQGGEAIALPFSKVEELTGKPLASRRTSTLPFGIRRRTDRFPIPSTTQDMTLTAWI